MTQRPTVRPQVVSTRCPFLLEETAQYCRLAPVSKLVPSREIAAQDQCCSTDAWRSCAWVPRAGVPRGDPDQPIHSATSSVDYCPFLAETLACSCAADSSSKLIPRTGLAVQRCLADLHRYCDVFLAHVAQRLPDRLPVVPDVALAPNHMWIDVGPDGSCHVGADALLVRVLGPVDDVTFLSLPGPGAASVVFSVAGVALPVTFPQPFDITGVNSALRRHLDRLTADPYGRGWLYEGWSLPAGRNIPDAQTVGLRRGAEAEAWLAAEVKRLVQHVGAVVARRGSPLGEVLGDGGEISASLAQHLDAAELLDVFRLFFSRASACGP